MLRRTLTSAVIGVLMVSTLSIAQDPTSTSPAPSTTQAALTNSPTPSLYMPFPNPQSDCQRCANAQNNNSPECQIAYKGVAGQYCFPWLQSGIRQACCCPISSRCPSPSPRADTCTCDSGASRAVTPVVYYHRTISPWVWVSVAFSVVLLCCLLFYCCCRPAVVAEPMYVEPAYIPQGAVYGQTGPVVVNGGPVVVGQPYGYGYGYPGYYGGGVGTGVAIGATAGVVGGVALGAAMAGGHGGYYGGGYYGGGYDGAYAGGGYGGGDFGGGGGGDFGGDF